MRRRPGKVRSSGQGRHRAEEPTLPVLDPDPDSAHGPAWRDISGNLMVTAACESAWGLDADGNAKMLIIIW